MRGPGPRFYVTGLGRSGTKWLAGMLSHDPDWNVLHEPYSGVFVDEFRSDRRSLARAAVWGRFAHADHYGEVNSHLRRYVCSYRGQPALRVGRQALLLRDPSEVMRSYMARRPRERWDRMAAALLHDAGVLARAADSGDFEVFRFVDLVTDPAEFAARAGAWAGVRVPGTALAGARVPVNASQRGKPPLLELGPAARRAVARACRALSHLL